MTNPKSESGFSLVELLAAVVILTIGSLLLAGGAIAVTRDLARSKRTTKATEMATQKVDQLRRMAASSNPRCQAYATSSSGSSASENITMTWTVGLTGLTRNIVVITKYPLSRGRTKTDTLTAVVPC